MAIEGQDVTLYEAKINFEQLGDGLVLGTDRVIVADGNTTSNSDSDITGTAFQDPITA